MINENLYIFQTNSNLDIQPGYPFSFDECVDIASPNGDVYVTMFGGEVDWISTNEPRGVPVITGTDRNGDLQIFVNGDGGTVFLGSVFTFGFLQNRETGGMVDYEKTTWKHFDEVLNSDHINFMGHQSTASMVGMEMKRISVKVNPGDTVVWAQYSGPRLEEGSTTLPENAKLVPMIAQCLTDEDVEKCKWVRSLTPEQLEAAKKAVSNTKNHYGDGTCYYNGVFPCNGCGECND